MAITGNCWSSWNPFAFSEGRGWVRVIRLIRLVYMRNVLILLWGSRLRTYTLIAWMRSRCAVEDQSVRKRSRSWATSENCIELKPKVPRKVDSYPKPAILAMGWWSPCDFRYREQLNCYCVSHNVLMSWGDWSWFNWAHRWIILRNLISSSSRIVSCVLRKQALHLCLWYQKPCNMRDQLDGKRSSYSDRDWREGQRPRRKFRSWSSEALFPMGFSRNQLRHINHRNGRCSSNLGSELEKRKEILLLE